MIRPFLVPLLALSLLGGCGTLAPAGGAHGDREAGRAFAERACAGCHSIGRTGVSPNARAPAFRDLAQARSDARLRDSLERISRNGHVQMPPVYITPDEMTALTAYIRSLTGRAT